MFLCFLLQSHASTLPASQVIDGSIFVGGAVSTALSLFTFFQRESVLRGLTTDAGIREASRIIFPAVLVTQGEKYVVQRLHTDLY